VRDPLPKGELLWLGSWLDPRITAGGIWLLMASFNLVLSVVTENAVTAIVGLVMVGIGARYVTAPRSGLIVYQHGVAIRVMRRVRELTWSEIDHFEIGRPFWKWALRIKLVDGRVLSSPGFEGRSEDKRRLASERVDELNRRAAAAAN
jgi:hypothetical protein